MSYKIYTGQPILSNDDDQIWAFWSKNIQIDYDRFHFITSSKLLNISSFEPEYSLSPIRNTYVYLDYKSGVWRASDGCVQKDFSENPNFIMSPLTGPQTMYDALNIILSNDKFIEHFKVYIGRDDIINHLDYYKERVNYLRRTHF